jgi:hypothetical protein
MLNRGLGIPIGLKGIPRIEFATDKTSVGVVFNWDVLSQLLVYRIAKFQKLYIVCVSA